MKAIKIITSGGADGLAAGELFREIAAANGIRITLEQSSVMFPIGGRDMGPSIGIFVDGQCMHIGAPSRKQVESWLLGGPEEDCCGFCGGQMRDFLKAPARTFLSRPA